MGLQVVCASWPFAKIHWGIHKLWVAVAGHCSIIIFHEGHSLRLGTKAYSVWIRITRINCEKVFYFICGSIRTLGLQHSHPLHLQTEEQQQWYVLHLCIKEFSKPGNGHNAMIAAGCSSQRMTNQSPITLLRHLWLSMAASEKLLCIPLLSASPLDSSTTLLQLAKRTLWKWRTELISNFPP